MHITNLRTGGGGGDICNLFKCPSILYLIEYEAEANAQAFDGDLKEIIIFP
jgi:hypothetical protein